MSAGFSQADAAILTLLQYALPGFLMVELEFPGLRFAWRYEDTLSVADKTRLGSGPAETLYRAFRQHGGHWPPPVQGVYDPILFARNELQDSSRPIILCGSADACFNLFTGSRARPDVYALVLDIAVGDVEELCGAAGFGPPLCVIMEAAEQRASYLLCAIDGIDTQLCDNMIAGAKTLAVNIRFDQPRWGTDGPVLSVELPEGVRPVLTVPVSRWLHDGLRRSEQTGSYAWLWIGTERHIRVLLGKVPDYVRRVRVVVPKAFSAENLLGIRLLVNGVVMPVTAELWQDAGTGAGAVTTLLPEDFSGELVLGVAVPQLFRAEDGATELAACIDTIELMP